METDSITDAAKASGIDRTTVYRWLKNDPAFEAELNRLKKDRVERLRADLRSLVSDAIATLRTITTDSKVPPNVRVRAALAVLNRFGDLRAEPIGSTDPEELKQAKLRSQWFAPLPVS